MRLETDPRARAATVTAAQMAEVDRRTVQAYQMSLLQMMENAGRALALVARDRPFGGSVAGARIAVLAGRGGNGGGALVAARRLAGWGAQVEIFTPTPRARPLPEVARQAGTALAFGVPLREIPDDAQATRARAAREFDLVIDGLLGYGGSGTPRGAVGRLLAWAAEASTPILALDVPSGVDATTGEVAPYAIRADATVTLAAVKTGLVWSSAAAHVGALYLADIGIPAAAFEGMVEPAIVTSWFVADDVVRVA